MADMAKYEDTVNLYRAFVHMMHGKSNLDDVKAAMAGLDDGEVLEIRKKGDKDAKEAD